MGSLSPLEARGERAAQNPPGGREGVFEPRQPDGLIRSLRSQAAKLDFTPFPASRGKFVVADLRLGTRAEKPSRREEKPMGSLSPLEARVRGQPKIQNIPAVAKTRIQPTTSMPRLRLALRGAGTRRLEECA